MTAVVSTRCRRCHTELRDRFSRTLGYGPECRKLMTPEQLADAYAFATAFKRWEIADHWRRIPPAPNVLTAREPGTPPNDEFKARKAAITRKDDQP